MANKKSQQFVMPAIFGLFASINK